MKRLSLLMALAMIITIGGVYATWTYNEDPVAGDFHGHFNIGLEADTEHQKGSIVLDTSGLYLNFENSNGDYVPVMTVTGSAYIYFNPEDFVSDDVAEGKIDLRFKLTASDSISNEKFTDVANVVQYQFEEEDPIKVFARYDETEQTVRTEATCEFIEEGAYAGCYRYEITAEEFMGLIEFNTDVFKDHPLKSYAEFQAFQRVFRYYVFGVSIWEPSAEPNPST